MEQLSNSGSYDVKNYADLGSLFIHILLDLHNSVFTPQPHSIILLLIIVTSLRFRKVPLILKMFSVQNIVVRSLIYETLFTRQIYQHIPAVILDQGTRDPLSTQRTGFYIAQREMG